MLKSLADLGPVIIQLAAVQHVAVVLLDDRGQLTRGLGFKCEPSARNCSDKLRSAFEVDWA